MRKRRIFPKLKWNSNKYNKYFKRYNKKIKRYKYKIWIRVFVNNNLKGEPKIQLIE